MVAIDGDRVRCHRRHHHIERTAHGLRLQPVADLGFLLGAPHRPRQSLHQRFMTRAEAVFRRDHHFEAVARLASGQHLFQPAHDAADAVHVGQRLVTARAGDRAAFIVGEREMQAGNAAVGDFHGQEDARCGAPMVAASGARRNFVTYRGRAPVDDGGMAVRIGISSWRYAPWRGKFYPTGLAQRRELEYASRCFPSIEINGSFYSLQSPANWTRWHGETPDDFVFAVKGSRYITHMLRLRGIERALANFFASGLLRLENKLGPLLWQLPPSLKYDAEVMEEFLALLPRDMDAAEIGR